MQDAPKAETTTPVDEEGDDGAPSRPTARVMLVDDDEDLRFALGTYLRSRGLGVVAAADGEECLRLVEEGFRGVLLMDVMMPGLDGWDTIRALVDRGLYPGNLITMLTAKEQPDARMLGLQEYVLDYFPKPFRPTELLAAVTYYLDLLDPLP